MQPVDVGDGSPITMLHLVAARAIAEQLHAEMLHAEMQARTVLDGDVDMGEDTRADTRQAIDWAKPALE